MRRRISGVFVRIRDASASVTSCVQGQVVSRAHQEAGNKMLTPPKRPKTWSDVLDDALGASRRNHPRPSGAGPGKTEQTHQAFLGLRKKVFLYGLLVLSL